MQNPVKTSAADLLAQAALIARGADLHGEEIDLGPNTAEKIRFDIAALSAAVTAYRAAKDLLSNLRGPVRAMAIACRRCLMAARDSLKPTLGTTYNQRWNSTGLQGSIEISRSEYDILPLLSLFQSYFKEHPALELPSRQITAEHFGELYTQLESAIAAVHSQTAVAEETLRLRNARTKKLRSRLRATIGCIAHALDPVDARWAAFGLNQPGQKARPAIPQKVRIISVSETTAAIEWDRSPRAKHYRVRQKRKGTDEEAILAGSPADPDFRFDQLPAGSEIEITIFAVNSGGESAPSEVIVIKTVVPPSGTNSEAKAAKSATEGEEQQPEDSQAATESA